MDSQFGGTVISYDAALAAGLSRYYTGKECRNGHVAERLVSNKRCVKCADEKWRRRYAKHAARYKATAKRHYQIKSDLIKDRARRWYYDNPDRVKVNRKEYYWQNREKAIADVARWASEHPEMVRASHINRKAKRRGIEGRISASDILALIESQNGECICGAFLAEVFTVDHVMPFSRGGKNWPDNIQLLCLPCNLNKGTKTMDEWLGKS